MTNNYLWLPSSPFASAIKVEETNVPSILKRAFASGDPIATREFGKSELPTSITGFPGKNISEDGFGVPCVCMNIVRRCKTGTTRTQHEVKSTEECEMGNGSHQVVQTSRECTLAFRMYNKRRTPEEYVDKMKQ